MATFKDRVLAICIEVAAEFEGWKYVAGVFKNGDLKHTALIVSPGFSFDKGTTFLQPSIHVCNKRSMRLYKKIIGRDRSTSLVSFSDIENFQGEFRPVWESSLIVENKAELFRLVPDARKQEDGYLDIHELKPVLRAMMEDGMAMLNRYYDLSTEENLLRGLPPQYEPHYPWDTPPGMDGQNGIATCIAHAVVGDFEFTERYRRDDYKTGRPKNSVDLEKIVAVLSELRKRYEETGKVI
jgi:hypothetical protein